MLIQPPIDKLIEKLDNKYLLCCLINKRTRYLLDKRPAVLEEAKMKVISYAAQEVFDGKVIPVED